MPIVLQRVDERLIHGQVVLAWGSQLRPDRYLVVDDELADSAWEQDLYRLGADSVAVEFVGVEDARRALDGWRADPRRSILLTRDLTTMRELARSGLLAHTEVNLGGIHHGPERTQILTYLHLSSDDREAIRALSMEEGVEVSARDLPDAHRVGVRQLLGP